MGCFSWCTSDTRKSIPCVDDAYRGAPKEVYLLNPFGAPYKETAYAGYGEFAGHDVYELVAEWNRKYLSPANLRKPRRDEWRNDAESQVLFEKALAKYEQKCLGIQEYAAGASDAYMKEKYGNVFGFADGSDWKRCLGIAIACYDEQHVMLPYPIKIVERPCAYEDAKMSPSCPFQGCFYDGETLASLKGAVERAFDRLDAAQIKCFAEMKKRLPSVEEQIQTAEAQKTPDVRESKAQPEAERE